MEKSEFDALYSSLNTELSKTYYLIPKDKALLVIGGCIVFAAFTVGTSFLATKAAISGSAASKATTEIQSIKSEATTAKNSIDKLLADLNADGALNLGDVVCTDLKVVNDDGQLLAHLRRKDDEGGQLTLFTPQPEPNRQQLVNIYGDSMNRGWIQVTDNSAPSSPVTNTLPADW